MDPIFLQIKILSPEQNFFSDQNFFLDKIFFWDSKFFFEKSFGHKIFLDKNFVKPFQAEHFRLEYCLLLFLNKQ